MQWRKLVSSTWSVCFAPTVVGNVKGLCNHTVQVNCSGWVPRRMEYIGMDVPLVTINLSVRWKRPRQFGSRVGVTQHPCTFPHLLTRHNPFCTGVPSLLEWQQIKFSVWINQLLVQKWWAVHGTNIEWFSDVNIVWGTLHQRVGGGHAVS